MSQEALNREYCLILKFYPAGNNENLTADIFMRFFSFSIYSTGLGDFYPVLTLPFRFQ